MKAIIITSLIFIAIGETLPPVGRPAPTFTKPDIAGVAVNLESYRGRNVLLVLSRYIGCSWCQMFIIDLLNHADDLAKENVDVIIVTSSDAAIAGRYEPPRDFPFRLVPDPGMEIYKLYGVRMKSRGFTWNVFKKSASFVKYLPRYDWVKGGLAGPHLQPPACFAIDAAGVIRYEHIGKDVADNPVAGKLVEIFEEINKAP